jgi:hypothetical protein
MNIAAVIDVAPGRAGLSQATQTQTLLLEHLGPELGSIRLAVPHLLRFACLGAIGEKPDLLVVAGGPAAARRAGQVAHAHRLPILFLPGHGASHWARHLWGTLSLEDMVTALAQERLTPLRLPIGVAGGQIFFGDAVCGFLPQLRQLRVDLSEAETFAKAARLLAGAAGAFRLMFGRRVSIVCDGTPRAAFAVRVDAPAGIRRFGSFACAAWQQGAVSLARASLRAAAGGDWQSAHEPERFSCTKLTLRSGATTWLLLDGEAIAFRGAVELRYLPKGIETFAFAPSTRSDARIRKPFRSALNKPRGNPGPPSHVRFQGVGSR